MKMNVLMLILAVFATTNVLSQQPNTTRWVINKHKDSDTTTVKVNSTYFLLGTLNDYAGRSWGLKENIFDRYYPYEKPLMGFVDSLVKKDFKINLVEKDGCYFSNELYKKMNSFYKGNRIVDTLLFYNNQNKLSFLLGAYYRYGSKIGDGIYKIQLANSPKHNECYAILKQLNCKNIYFKRLDNIPTIYILYFEATGPILKYFDAIEPQKDKLFESFVESFRKSISVADFKELYKENQKDEHRMIISLFKSHK